MKRVLGICFVAVIIIAALYLKFGSSEDEEVIEEVLVQENEEEEVLRTPPSDALEEKRTVQQPRLLRYYGSTQQTAKDDVELVDSVLRRFWILFKNPDLIRVGSNAEILESLMGDNPDGIEFVSKSNQFIDTNGQLLDRWGTPLFFHAQSMTQIEIRSAGPDGKMYTDDDVITGSRGRRRQ